MCTCQDILFLGKSSHGIYFTCVYMYLRLLPTFAGILRKKIRTRAGFNKILTNYISEKSLINGVYDKNIV